MDEAGVPGIRPIGMPEVSRKLVGSALMTAAMPSARRSLTPWQRAIGTSGACEDLIHEVDTLLNLTPTHSVLQLDFKNAFNLISRIAALEVIRRALTLLEPYFLLVYGGEPPPVYGWAPPVGEEDVPVRLSLLVERDAQQCDPLGPLLHALALHLALLKLVVRTPTTRSTACTTTSWPSGRSTGWAR
eukprot:TRINITY_DN19837_c0_g1_i1.p4 TRINITY_DN19837_c0_g1~~TRINITY_DN19837_c0_g1_i1.p4  ORF type:complete len:187 (+),score=41.79 TRINITY_DN19837_c0_g1_i1:59-619(+)